MEVPISGQALTIESTHPVLVARTSGGYELQAEVGVTITSESGASCSGDIEEPDVMDSPLWEAVQGIIESASVDGGGGMRVTFRSGGFIEFHPEVEYESWSATGPNGFRIVCMPGGELAIWSGTEGYGAGD